MVLVDSVTSFVWLETELETEQKKFVPQDTQERRCRAAAALVCVWLVVCVFEFDPRRSLSSDSMPCMVCGGQHDDLELMMAAIASAEKAMATLVESTPALQIHCGLNRCRVPFTFGGLTRAV